MKIGTKKFELKTIAQSYISVNEYVSDFALTKEFFFLEIRK